MNEQRFYALSYVAMSSGKSIQEFPLKTCHIVLLAIDYFKWKNNYNLLSLIKLRPVLAHAYKYDFLSCI